jgi:hypothetical protein
MELPDRRFTEAFYTQLAHLRMFVVHNTPRISPISYPLFWLRDSSYIINALNKGGYHDLTEQICWGTKGRDSFGGFGSEADGPSHLIWIYSEHYLLTRDKTFLKDLWSDIARLADLIIRMIHTDKPIKIFTEHVIPQLKLEPFIDILCVPAQDGLIKGSMDIHFAWIWINSFAWLALTRTARLAQVLNLDNSHYLEEAEKLLFALTQKSRDIFGQDERDVNVAFWPAGWAKKEDRFIMEKFDEFWNKVRCPNGNYTPEPLWTYFEAGQAHNNILNGNIDRAWISIEHFLSCHTAPGLYTYHEGESDENSAQLWQRTRGWDDIQYVTPHGWTAAEVFLLLRDCLLHETEDGIVIGAGIPKAWQGQDFYVTGLPSYHGIISFKHRANGELIVSAPLSANKVISAIPWNVKITMKDNYDSL